MKKLTLAALMAYAGLVGMNAHAAPPSADFEVTITLTSACEITQTPGAIAMAYTSFVGLTSADNTTSIGMRCTDDLAYTLQLDGNATGSVTNTDTAVGLDYTLTWNHGQQTGTGAAQSHTVTASIAPGLAGACTSGTCSSVPGSNTHTLTVSY